MNFHSILFASERQPAQSNDAPDYFQDLNCDQLVDGFTVGKEEYNLRPYFYTCLKSVDAIVYRQSIMRDLDNPDVIESVKSFARDMHQIREYLAKIQKLYSKEQQECWFLYAIENYCNSVINFVENLLKSNLESIGFRRFRDYLVSYTASDSFKSLRERTQKLKDELADVSYCVLIKGDKVWVRNYDAEADYSVEVAKTFEKFAQGAVKDYRLDLKASDEMNHIEAKILELVAKLNPSIFSELAAYCARNAAFLDKTIVAFDREIQFYVSYLDYIAVLRQAGLEFCYPRVVREEKEVSSTEGFDLALARKLVEQKSAVVCNDFHLSGQERILVVSGPNQGGKTTFARTFGQLHYLANLGCPVPGRGAQLFLFDHIFTHFERQEKVENLRGKLEDDLIRVHGILQRATSKTIIILNEIFTSTTFKDEQFLSEKIMEKIIERDVLAVWVTFIDKLASFAPQTVSVVSTIAPENPALRTFKIVRRQADGLAYAAAIALKHRLTYGLIKQRIGS